MKKIILSLFLGILFVPFSAFASGIILILETDNGGRTSIGSERQAIFDATERIRRICRSRGESLTGVNVHATQCSWRRAGEVKTCQALVVGSCSDIQMSGPLIAINQSVETQEFGDIDLSEAKCANDAKRLAIEKCTSLGGREVGSVASSLCDGPTDVDDLKCKATSVVACHL